MIQVHGQKYKQLVEALADAFPTTDDIARMLQFRLERRLGMIVALPNRLTQVAFDLIQQSNAGGWTGDLIVAARESQPNNPKLIKLAADFGLTAATSGLERKIREELAKEVAKLAGARKVA